MERQYVSHESGQKRRRVGRRIVATSLISTTLITGIVIGFEKTDFFRGNTVIDASQVGPECGIVAPQASKSLLDVSFDGKPFSGVQVASTKFAGLSLTALPDVNSWAQTGVLVGKNENGSAVIRANAERKVSLGSVLAVGTGGSLSEVSRLEVSDVKPEVGETLCVMSYESTKDGKPRFPKSNEQGYDKPAVYGGQLLSLKDGKGVIVTLKDFGEDAIGSIPETSSRPGAAGGAIVNEQGKLIGVILPDYPSKTVDEIESEFAVDIKGMTGEQRASNYTLTVFQLVTPDTVELADKWYSLHERVNFSTAEGCNPEADLRNLEGVAVSGEKVPVDENLLQVIDTLSTQFDVTLSCIISGHSIHRADTGEVSDHVLGKSLDIKFDMEKPEEARKLVEWLYTNRQELGLKEVLSPWVIGEKTDAIPFGTNDDHKNHIHVAVV